MSKPIRMCIMCKGRYFQNELLRLQKKEDVIRYSGCGRSFYLCRKCAMKDNIDFIMQKRFKLNSDTNFSNIKKEFLSDG